MFGAAICSQKRLPSSFPPPFFNFDRPFRPILPICARKTESVAPSTGAGDDLEALHMVKRKYKCLSEPPIRAVPDRDVSLYEFEVSSFFAAGETRDN